MRARRVFLLLNSSKLFQLKGRVVEDTEISPEEKLFTLSLSSLGLMLPLISDAVVIGL